MNFKQFFLETDIRSWLLDRKPKQKVSIIPPAGWSPEQLLKNLEYAEAIDDPEAIAKAEQLIKQYGYVLNWKREIVRKNFC
jgi:hypothetical protein